MIVAPKLAASSIGQFAAKVLADVEEMLPQIRKLA